MDWGWSSFEVTESTIIKLICGNNGAINYDELLSNLTYGSLGSIACTIENSDNFAVVNSNGEKRVLVKTKLKLCKVLKCAGCGNLHLCKLYLYGNCRRRVCQFSHDLHSGHNTILLQEHNLQDLLKEELRVLLLQSDTSLLPAVCHSYNNGTGEYGKCQDGENCKRLHICEKYLRGPCTCTRLHDFHAAHPWKALRAKGVPSELLTSMKAVYTNIEALRDFNKGKNPRSGPKQGAGAAGCSNAKFGSRPGKGQGSEPKTTQNSTSIPEICMYFVKGSCKHGDKCRREHSKLPYKWEVMDGQGWAALPDNEEIEKDFCNPAKTYSTGIEPVCFDTMTKGLRRVRRLSTVSSVIQPTFILTTEWVWYWEDEYGKWIQYASIKGGHNMASLGCEDLEQKYQENNNAVVEFTAGSQTYELSFQDMIQKNKRYGTKKLVRRRPVFVSSADAQKIRTSKKPLNNQLNFKALPDNWDKSLTPETGYKRVTLQRTSSEYKEILAMFNKTMHDFSVVQIERIQNRALWEVYQWQRDFMKKQHSDKNVTEKQLFHGTDSKHIDAICTNNFDWRICGTHGTAYGKGSYFARDARYSHSYTGQSGTRSMFICRILVGEYTKGHSSYLRPPSKDGGDTIFYDSCVDDVYNPSIFVVFEKHQIYPEYLIQYREVTPASAVDSFYYQPVTRQATVYNPKPAPAPAPAPTPTYRPPAHTYRPAAAASSPAPSVSSFTQSYSTPKAKSDNSCIIS
ncbi:protein mono-ADP-ribosyltransferase PARP12-like [Chanos chanos]|uniref:Protein mono-ADP-ribosyltransferase PARP12-like n=1 Tax=Chanos chanos TaxID=29144 RepID=A0A6J2VLN8_CHACN|nr:protein mono-ADP-ribosyltransferase PARP12-like [Chanos chanos]